MALGSRPSPEKVAKSSSAGNALVGLWRVSFKHDALEHPKRQIRLLKPLRHLWTLQFELVSVSMEDAPPYAAISYVWGRGAPTNTILINSKIFRVRSSLMGALEQAWRCHKDNANDTFGRWSHLWIDAICIDQDNATEKTHQVTMMGGIYDAATTVLASLGAHADGSHLLFKLAGLSTRSFIWDDSGTLETIPSRTSCHTAALDWCWFDTPDRAVSRLDVLSDGIYHFGTRPYWTRLWIVQEVYGRDNLWLMCGDHASPIRIWQEFYATLTDKLGKRFTPSLPMAKLIDWGGPKCKNSLNLSAALDAFRDYGCADPRDRVFGLYNVLDWHNKMTIQPDYHLTKTELAKQVLEYVAIEQAISEPSTQSFLNPRLLATTLAALELSVLDKDVKDLVNNRCIPSCSGAIPPLVQQSSNWPQTHKFGLTTSSRYYSFVLFKGRNDYLEIRDDFGWVHDDNAKILSYTSVHDGFRSIKINDRQVGIACVAAKEHDILAAFPSDRWVILREASNNRYRIIGRALVCGMSEGHRLQTGSFQKHLRRPYTSFQYWIGTEDLIALMSLSPEDRPETLDSLHIGITTSEDEMSSYAVRVQE